MIPAMETTEQGEWSEIHWALEAGGRRVVTIVAIASLNRFLARPIWEMSATSPDSPAIIGGPAFVPSNKVSASFEYIGVPQTDPGFQFNVSVVPEPSGLVLAEATGCIGLLTWRRRTAIASC